MITRHVYGAYHGESGMFYHGCYHGAPKWKKTFRVYSRLSDLMRSLGWCRKETLQDIVIYTYSLNVENVEEYAG